MAMKADYEHADWQEKTLLILGSTYPNPSTKYVEVACTGAVDEETGHLVRIHPMPRRYLEPEHRFQNFQRVRARIKPDFSDGRPESMRIDPTSIAPLDVIPAKEHEKRRRYVERSPNLVGSVEELHDRYRSDGMSLGIVQPKEILGVKVKDRDPQEIAGWRRRHDDMRRQMTMGGEPPPRPLDCPTVDFHARWRCDDARCTGHDMTMKAWGLHELYRKLEGSVAERKRKVEDTMTRALDLTRRDVFMFLGTFVSRRYEFGLMDAFTPERKVQLSLL
jgi:hypothetical protein